MKKIVSFCFAFIMVIFSGCTGEKESVLRIALQTTAQGVPAYIAETDGILTEAGLNYESMVYSTGVAQLEALGADGLDVACIGAPPALTAYNAYDARIIGFVLNESSTELFVRPDSDILTSDSPIEGIRGNADAWRGKTIILPLNTTSHYIILSQLTKLGLSSSDVNLINMDVGQAYTAFKSGQADVVCLWDPNSFKAEDEGWVSVMYGPETDAVCPCVLIASQKAIETKPEMIKTWLKSYYQVVESEEFNLEKFSSSVYTLFTSNNIVLTEDEAVKFAERKQMYTLEDAYNAFFKKTGNGLTVEEEYFNNIAKFFYDIGSYTADDYEKVTDGGLFYTDFIKEIYK